MRQKTTRFALVAALSLGVLACDEAVNPTAPEEAPSLQRVDASRPAGYPSIVDIAVESASDEESPEFTILVQALQAAGYVDALSSEGQFTVFAPTDAAFARLLDLLGVTAEELLADTGLLMEVLKYHVAPGKLLSGEVLSANQIRTFSGAFLAPLVTDEGAFIVDGSDATDDAQLLAPDLIDIEATNGVIHVIDEVLLPGMGEEPSKERTTIADVVVSLATADEPEFTVLLAALQAAGFADELAGHGQFTVFAPTDAAFADLLALLDVSAEELLADTDLLMEVLKYHVAPGRLLSGDVLGSERIRTFNGEFVFPLANADGAFIVDGSDATADAQLLAPDLIDIETDNGVIHVIDAVLLPGMGDEPMKERTTIADVVVSLATADEPEFTVLLAALQAAGFADELAGHGQFTVFAPTDAAFADLLALLDVSAEELLADTDLLMEVLKYHVAPGRLLSGDVLGSEQIRTLNGGFVFPLANADGAFIVDGSDATADAQLLAPDLIDIETDNGVIHVIDAVLLPGMGDEPMEERITIADVVVSLATADEPEFTVLLAALQAAGFADELAGKGQFTVFAPTDAAFGRLLALLGVSAEELLADTGLLMEVLKYHVAPGRLLSGDVLASERIHTFNGGFVFPLATAAGAFIVDGSDATADAQLLAPDLIDIETDNGVIHVIDEVLLP